ncbi:MAG: STAS domain-containing protein [Desulfuromonadaceae bacterium]|nr:STAS domain-containing protein [Desulfuromonadaceae bacterium]MDD5107028.1 STAS domain-containing protein [Desulfuromonadaceae bacterium]
MTVETRIDGDNVIATVCGEIDGKTAPQVQTELLAALQEGKRLLLDMRGVTFLSSAGLRMLLLLYRQIAARKGKVVLVGVSEEIRDTMSMTGFINFFILADTLEAGLSALS